MPSSFHTLCHENTLRLAWGKVKSKDAAGGIDGITLAEFEKSWHKELATLAEELRSGQWKPMPYLEIEVAKTKHPDEKRRLGMTSIRDKIVQQAIKIVIEP